MAAAGLLKRATVYKKSKSLDSQSRFGRVGLAARSWKGFAMNKRTVEIDDTLQDRVDGAIAEVEEHLRNWLSDNPDADEAPCLHNDLDYSGTVHEIVDGSVPVYTSEIEDTWYLYSAKLEEAYENAGMGENMRENGGMVAIYCYIYEQVCEWYSSNAEEIFDAWRNENPEDEEAGE